MQLQGASRSAMVIPLPRFVTLQMHASGRAPILIKEGLCSLPRLCVIFFYRAMSMLSKTCLDPEQGAKPERTSN